MAHNEYDAFKDLVRGMDEDTQNNLHTVPEWLAVENDEARNAGYDPYNTAG